MSLEPRDQGPIIEPDPDGGYKPVPPHMTWLHRKMDGKQPVLGRNFWPVVIQFGAMLVFVFFIVPWMRPYIEPVAHYVTCAYIITCQGQPASAPRNSPPLPPGYVLDPR